MDFELSEEQQLVKDMAAAFADKEVKAVASRMDRDAAYPSELVRRLGEIGFMGMCVPLEFGGSGMDFVSYIIAMEAISKAWASLSVTISVITRSSARLSFASAAPPKEKYLACGQRREARMLCLDRAGGGFGRRFDSDQSQT